MTNVMTAAHTEARKIVANRRYSEGPISYRQALVIGLRRAHAKVNDAKVIAILAARAETPKFMWLRGL